MTKSPFKTLGALVLMSLVAGANAASISLMPTSNTMNLSAGDVVTFDIVMDFSGEPTIGGSFDVAFDSSALRFDSFFREPSIGIPEFSRDPDILDGLLENWMVGSFNGLLPVATLGNVAFSVLPTMGTMTNIALQDTNSATGFPWQDGFDTVYAVNYNSVELSRIPVPAAVWFMLSALGALFRFRPKA